MKITEEQYMHLIETVTESQVMVHKMDAMLDRVVTYVDNLEYKMIGENRQLLRHELMAMGYLDHPK